MLFFSDKCHFDQQNATLNLLGAQLSPAGKIMFAANYHAKKLKK